MIKMSAERMRNVWKYVLPTMLSSICMFLFTIVDGIFVGRGVGTDALGAVNIAFPIVMVLNALYILATLGGVTVCAIRLGRGDVEGANKVCIHSLIFTFTVGAVFTIIGTLFAKPICVALGASETFLRLASDYLFWYTVFAIPAGLTVCLQGFCRNDGSPVLCSIAVTSTAVCNIFLDWLFIFPLKMGTSEGLQPLFGQSYGEKNESDLRFYYYVGFDINVFGSTLVTILVVLFARPICALFGTDRNTLDYVVETMPKFSWAFIPMSFNVMVSAYFYSTKRTNYAIVINLLRSLCTNALAILILPLIFGEKIIWFTFGISEAIVACVSLWFVILARRKGIEFK